MSDDTNTGEGGPGAMPDDQAASFAALMEGAGEQEKEAAAQVSAQQDQQLAQQVADNAQMLEAAWAIVGGLLPEKIAARYGPEQRALIASTGTALAIKRNWSGAAFMAQWGVEIAFGAALLGPSIPVVLESIKNRKAGPAGAALAMAEAPEAAPILADQVPGSKTVTFGAPAS